MESQEANKNNKTLKIGEKIFFGGIWGPPKTPKIAQQGFLGAPNPPQKIFFQQFILLASWDSKTGFLVLLLLW